MLSALAFGTVLGLSAGMAPGPLLTLVITQSLRHGGREGVKVALAPLITDFPIVLAALAVLSGASHSDIVFGLIALAGGAYVLYLAYESARIGPVQLDTSDAPPRSVRKGALLNALNPHPYLFWATVGAPFILESWKKHPLAPVAFVGSFYTLLVGSKVLLALLIGRSRTLLKGKGYVYTMRVLAAALALFALVLIKNGLTFLGIV